MIAQNYRLQRWKIEKILKKGASVKVELFIVKYLENKLDHSRFSVTMSAKFEKLATIRNRKKRQVYEAIRNLLKEDTKPKKNTDMVLIPYKKLLTCGYNKIYSNINNIFTLLK